MDHTGGNALAYACSYVPVEIITASGLSPYRLIPKGRCASADSRIHPNTCFYVKAVLADLLDKSFSQLRGMVFVNSCDAMRKLYDIWADHAGSPGAVIIDIPKKKDAESIRYFASELKRLAREIQERFSGTAVTRDSLEEAIREGNRLRSLMRGVLDRQALTKGRTTGTDVFPLLIESSLTGLKLHAEKIGTDREPVDPSGRSGGARSPRIVMTGTMMGNPEIVSLFERKNARLVAFDTCFGMRHYARDVQEGSPDPYTALAERYLLRAPCPRMDGVGEQVEYLKGLVRDTQADGVVITCTKYCDHILYSLPLIQEGIRQTGKAMLVLENDYEWSDMEKARIKIEAFLEMLG